ncbi:MULTISPECIES: alpha/beta hydrolase [unclassified Mycobacterium]|uniref:alpha/beta fold hydrolase n=1 Tax=unclassified Mycobacterium TaxID=2642494 RepID=UPI0029C6FE47|nr:MULTISPECIES: alpha/beta hydrolase [unclassified Mycobacterium]
MAMRPAAEVFDVELEHLRMSALAWGPADGRLVICLHGFPDSAWSWRHVGAILGDKGFRVVAPFMRGYAPTALPADRDYHIGALAYDAAQLCHALGGQDAVVVGHDWGAFASNALAANPDSPFGLHVSMSVPPIGGMTPRRGSLGRHLRLLPGQMRMSWYVMYFQLPWLPERTVHRIIAKLWRDWSPGYDGADDVAHALDALPTLDRRAAALAYYRALGRNTRAGPRYADMHGERYGLPRGRFLYLHGTDDGCMQPGFVDLLRDVLPPEATATMIPNAGHFLQVEQPEVVAAEIERFLKN